MAVAGGEAQAEETYDVVVIGSGLGGLSAGALSAKYGHSVLVCEAHSIAGGCAHAFERAGYTFDSGPSLWSGCAAPSTNPLRQVLDAVGESPEWVQYGGWNMYTPEAPEGFFAAAGDMGEWKRTMAQLGDGERTVRQWDKLLEFIEPLQRAVLAVPPIALRADIGAVLTAGPYMSAMADPRIGLRAYLLSGPWSAVLEAAGVTDPWLRNWFDFLAFAFSGLPSDGTVAAAMIYMLAELHADGAKMDYPIGGSGAVVDALVRGLEKHGGELRLKSRVDEILVDEGDGRCTGVRLAGGRVVHARRAVISNAPVWQTASLLPAAARAAVRATGSAPLDASTPPTPSFVHLHLGIRADGLSEQALTSIHHIVVPEWEKLTQPQSTAFVSVPSLLDPSLAPEGKAVIHAYLPATEPYEVWEGLKRGSDEYEALKTARAAPLYAAIERFIPDVRDRIEVEMVGSPLTHERFLRRHRGTYGPELSAADATFPGARTAVDGLLACGDSCWPGIGVPAVAGSGIAAAHVVTGAGAQRELLSEMREQGTLLPA
jgi:phytoene dehydrogenase-like protein